MVTDDERRSAAEGLRFSVGKNPMTMPQAGRSIINAMCPYGFTSWNDILLNLADLIEPTSPTSRHDASDIDREALLAISEEMLSVSIGINSADNIRPLEAAYILQGYARRIREACGEARDE